MAAHSNMFTTTNTHRTPPPGYYGRTVEVRTRTTTTFLTPTATYFHTVTTRSHRIPALIPLSPQTPLQGSINAQIPANQALGGFPSEDLFSVPQETPMGRGFPHPTGFVMNSQGSSEPAAPRDVRTHSLPVPGNGFSVVNEIHPGNINTHIPANQAPREFPLENFSSVPLETPMGLRFPPPTGSAISSQGSSEPALVWDGRTHSLPTQKYGPYVCSKCNFAVMTSQLFASHVKKHHYKDETFEERNIRLAARANKRKRQTTLQDNGGATVGPSNAKRAKVMTRVKPEPEV